MKIIYYFFIQKPLKKPKYVKFAPPCRYGIFHFVLHLYQLIIYQNKDLDFSISKIGTKCEKILNEKKRAKIDPKKQNRYFYQKMRK